MMIPVMKKQEKYKKAFEIQLRVVGLNKIKIENISDFKKRKKIILESY